MCVVQATINGKLWPVVTKPTSSTRGISGKIKPLPRSWTPVGIENRLANSTATAFRAWLRVRDARPLPSAHGTRARIQPPGTHSTMPASLNRRLPPVSHTASRLRSITVSSRDGIGAWMTSCRTIPFTRKLITTLTCSPAGYRCLGRVGLDDSMEGLGRQPGKCRHLALRITTLAKASQRVKIILRTSFPGHGFREAEECLYEACEGLRRDLIERHPIVYVLANPESFASVRYRNLAHVKQANPLLKSRYQLGGDCLRRDRRLAEGN